MKKTIALLLALCIVFAFAACGERETVTPSDELSEEFRVGFLKGPTGIGAAKLMNDFDGGKLQLNYKFTVEADASAISAALISGELDVAAVPTNMASVLFNKTGGKIKIIAVNTLGVLHILENGNEISSVADLKGKTIYATGQGSNPEYVLNYVLRRNGLEPGTDVTVEYLASDELTAKAVSGDVKIAMLPVPAATTVMIKNPDVRDALDLTAEWGKVSDSTLTQGCIVARTDELSENELKIFLDEYSASIEYMKNDANIDDAAALTEKYEIVGSAAIAKKAIPQAGLTFIVGKELMSKSLDEYFAVLNEANPSSIGGKLPTEDIYFEAK